MAPRLWGAALLLLTALGIRAASLPSRSWWIDELISRDVARLPLWTAGSLSPQRPPFTSILAFCIHDTGPGPLTYLLDGLFAPWAEPMGGEFWMRLPALTAGGLIILLLLTSGHHLTGDRRGAFAMAGFAAVMPAIVDYSTTPRGYAWAMLFGLLHLTALAWAGFASLRRRQTAARLGWTLAALSGCAAVLVHAVSVVWVAACLLAAITLPGRRGRASRAGAAATGLVISAVTTAYLAAWLPRLAATPNVIPPRRALDEVIAQMTDVAIPLLHDGTVVLLVLTAAMIAMAKDRRPVTPRIASRAVWLALALSAALILALAGKFFLAPRHLFPAQLALLVLLGTHAGRTLRPAAGAANSRRAYFIARTILLLTWAVALPFAVKTAATPVQDWRTAIRTLAAAFQPGDIILCGPNSDFEVVRAYGAAVGIPRSAVPRWIDDGSSRLADALTEDGLRTALASPARIWFITGFYGQIRPPSYWALIEQHFRRTNTTSTGRLPVDLLLRDPADKSF